jgi:hypothetical protein
MVEPQLFLQLLMRLFTDPPCLDGSCQRLERNVSGQIRDVVLLLSARSSFAQDPHLVATDAEALRAAEALTAEFDAVDPGSDAFRFAHDTKGRSVKLALSEVDLANLRKVMANLHNFLKCVACHGSLHQGDSDVLIKDDCAYEPWFDNFRRKSK